MLGKRAPKPSLGEADQLYLEHVGPDSFYGFLAGQRGRLFRDEDFAALCCADNGRPSVPPSLLATALLLQTDEGVADEAAKARADFDLRWKVALGIGLADRPFAKSTLQLFRAQLVLHDEVRAVFQRSLTFARRTGYSTSRRITAVLDTSYILGRGAVKDTYNLLADGIVRVLRVLARQAGVRRGDRDGFAAWATAAGYGRYVGHATGETSVKGAAALDWDDAAARERFLGELVAAADRVLEAARVARGALPAGSPEEAALVEAAGVVSRVLCQDVARKEAGGDDPSVSSVSIVEGTAPDRLVSAHDPEMRHGRKSARKRFDGHKAAVAVATDAQLITAVDVLAGNAPDATGALALVEQSEQATGCPVAETYGDCAFGDGETRQAFADAGRVLRAKVPVLPNHGGLPKTAFRLDLEARPGPTCTCPGGHTTAKLAPTGRGRRVFIFPAAVCAACPLRPQCLTEPNGHASTPRRSGRTILLHPQEALLQAARAFQHSPAFAAVRRRRQAAEHRLARLVQLGVRQARYVGRAKTLFQLLLAATVANLTLLASSGTAGAAAGAAAAVSSALAGLLTALVLALGPPLAPDGAPPAATCRGRRLATLPVSGLGPPRRLATSRPGF
jgi:hypothetical protein